MDIKFSRVYIRYKDTRYTLSKWLIKVLLFLLYKLLWDSEAFVSDHLLLFHNTVPYLWELTPVSNQLWLQPLFRISEVVTYDSFNCIWNPLSEFCGINQWLLGAQTVYIAFHRVSLPSFFVCLFFYWSGFICFGHSLIKVISLLSYFNF